MALHPEAQAVVDESAAAPAIDMDAISPQEMRAGALAMWSGQGPYEPVGSVTDRTIPGPAGEIPVRIYLPAGDAAPSGVLVWMHGGGWVIGSLDENERACRAVCARSGAAIVSVDYRLAPEHRFPAAADDVFAAVEWAAAEYGDAPIAVGGESAGGNLAAVAALMARDRGRPTIALQLLVSPVLGRPEDGRASYDTYADGFFLSRESMEWFFRQYPRDAADLSNPYMVPLAAEDLGGVAPALILSAECDVLHDEASDYAQRLTDAGVPAELVEYAGHIHGFFGLLDQRLTVSAEAHAKAATALRDAFGAAVEIA
jgi:acetyl esterase